MKKISFLLFSLSFALISVAQFTEIPVPYSEQFYSIAFQNADKGYIMTDRGTVLKTIDGGANWDSIPTGYMSWLNAGVFLSDDVGYVGGGANFPVLGVYPSNLILKTEDDGLSYDSLFADYSGGDIQHIAFADADHGVFAGSYSNFKTDDGGLTIDTLVLPNATLNFSVGSGLAYPDLNNLYLSTSVYLGTALYEWKVYKSTDQGENFTVSYLDTVNGYYNGSNLSFLTGDLGFIAGPNGSIIRTTDGGANWSTIFADTSMVFHDLAYVTEDIGFLVGRKNGSGEGYLLSTIDGGLSWQQEFIDSMMWSPSMAVTNNILYVANSSTLYKTAIDSFPTVVNSINQTSRITLHLFPNPCDAQLHLDYPKGVYGHLTLAVFDTKGSLVLESPVDKENAVLSTELLREGMYFLRLSDGKSILAYKQFMKQ